MRVSLSVSHAHRGCHNPLATPPHWLNKKRHLSCCYSPLVRPQSTMGNMVQCCHMLSGFCKCKDEPSGGMAERSPLLSSRDSDSSSTSTTTPADSEDDILTVSTDVPDGALHPEHFLFPDIVLSSHLGGDATLVEPMVCLLVSEEEEGKRMEVETQTQQEPQVGLPVHTATVVEKEQEVFMLQEDHEDANRKLACRTTAVSLWSEDVSGAGAEDISDEEKVDTHTDHKTEKDQRSVLLQSKTQTSHEEVGRAEMMLQADVCCEDLDDHKQPLRDIINLQEMTFSVRIKLPGADILELQVLGQTSVAELQQMLMDHELTCHRTCFSLHLDDTMLDAAMQLSSMEGLCGGMVKVVEESYSIRDARFHLRHVQDLLRSLDPTEAFNGANGRSVSHLTCFTQNRSIDGKSERSRWSPPDFLLPGSLQRPLLPLHPVHSDSEHLQCVRVLAYSSWNPPPGYRKMHGDLMYLHAVTMEGREVNITSSTRGFHLNQSTAFTFNPKPALPTILCHSLVELLSQVSSAFKKNFSSLQRRRIQQHPYERMVAPFPVFTWMAPHEDHSLDCIRVEDVHASRVGQDQHTAGQCRDWNEELQRARELPRNSPQDCLHRGRILFKTNRDFVEASRKGAVAVVDGHVMPLNPGEPPHMQMFLWNNIFFSLARDIAQHYRPLGGDAAAHAAASCDLRGVQAYTSVDTEGLHTLGSAVVDYRGFRVIAQTIVPGILEKNQEQSILYGSTDHGRTIMTHPRFVQLLEKASKPLRIQPHQVLDHRDTPVELYSGVETKGILGNDGRHYILDLLRTFPADLNFQYSEETQVNIEEVPKECQSFGYPQRHHHSLANLRPELMNAFVQHRYDTYLKIAGTHQRGGVSEWKEPVDNRKDTDHDKASGGDFDIRFNPDLCSPGVRFVSAEDLSCQRRLLWDAAAFLLSSQIPLVLQDCLDHRMAPMDGATLTSVLHQRGVNIRYLGTLLRQLDNMEDSGRHYHVQRMCVIEMVTRSAKHVFRTYLQEVEHATLSAAVSHFLNCLLTSSTLDSSDQMLSRRRSHHRRRSRSHCGRAAGAAWARLTPSELWVRIRTDAEDYYHYTLDSAFMEDHGLQRVSLLREFTIKTGIQVRMRDYTMDSRTRAIFGEEDVVNMLAVVKHVTYTASSATWLLEHAYAAVRRGHVSAAFDLVSQALMLFTSVCGALHEDTCTCLRLLGRLSYTLGQHANAVRHQERAVMSSERTRGVDHPQTIHDYTWLALYCVAAGQHCTSLRLLYRARYLTLLVTGDDHPHIALLDSMLGVVLHGLMELDLSLKFLHNASILTSKYHGATSTKHAHSHHLLALLHHSRGDFESARRHESQACSIYETQVGQNHDRSRESSKYLKDLTQQAGRSIKQDSKLTPPPQCFHTMLQQLNMTCEDDLIPLRAEESTRLRLWEVKVQDLEKCLSSNTFSAAFMEEADVLGQLAVKSVFLQSL
ncbi:clustered mitochondria protein homolog isoform X2 [Dunckerocampus dactyliophorus]|uniref:clustered mitochondria protein homolog isoform X2 n=1 Tax=Dunckerocampus dactyliophorus TaxID=161453 RepID=UPI0024077388|nr:clustered mitochondria protein homolog isoform X2 [Dunckerocampus dactyliophorus]